MQQLRRDVDIHAIRAPRLLDEIRWRAFRRFLRLLRVHHQWEADQIVAHDLIEAGAAFAVTWPDEIEHITRRLHWLDHIPATTIGRQHELAVKISIDIRLATVTRLRSVDSR